MEHLPPIYPHADIEEIGSDLFMLRGSIKMNAMLRISRNMAIIRNGNELSLINPVRLNDRGEQQLRALGEVKNLIRLGCFHGVDDPYYVEKFGARMWSQPGGTTFTEPDIDVAITPDTELPFDNGEIFEFQGLNQPECALLIDDGAGLLLTCDAIQNYGNYSYNNFFASLIMPFIGFPRTTIVGPIWLKMQSPEGTNLEGEFRRLLNLKFDRLLSAHGTLLESGAHAAVERAVNKVFAGKS
jgi:hypothetical protein